MANSYVREARILAPDRTLTTARSRWVRVSCRDREEIRIGRSAEAYTASRPLATIKD